MCLILIELCRETQSHFFRDVRELYVESVTTRIGGGILVARHENVEECARALKHQLLFAAGERAHAEGGEFAAFLKAREARHVEEWLANLDVEGLVANLPAVQSAVTVSVEPAFDFNTRQDLRQSLIELFAAGGKIGARGGKACVVFARGAHGVEKVERVRHGRNQVERCYERQQKCAVHGDGIALRLAKRNAVSAVASRRRQQMPRPRCRSLIRVDPHDDAVRYDLSR